MSYIGLFISVTFKQIDALITALISTDGLPITISFMFQINRKKTIFILATNNCKFISLEKWCWKISRGNFSPAVSELTDYC